MQNWDSSAHGLFFALQAGSSCCDWVFEGAPLLRAPACADEGGKLLLLPPNVSILLLKVLDSLHLSGAVNHIGFMSASLKAPGTLLNRMKWGGT